MSIFLMKLYLQLKEKNNDNDDDLNNQFSKPLQRRKIPTNSCGQVLRVESS